jgi:RNA binding exosome subunit
MGKGAAKSRVQSVEVVYFVHATEDPARLERAATELLGVRPPPETETLEGHFGNRIVRVRFHAVGDEAESTAMRVFGAMPPEMRKEVASRAGSLVDEHSSLYLRFDKQTLVLGRLSPGGGDPVRVKVKPRLFRAKGGAVEIYRSLLEESRAG